MIRFLLGFAESGLPYYTYEVPMTLVWNKLLPAYLTDTAIEF